MMRLRVALVAAVLMAGPVTASEPPCIYDELVDQAVDVVQLTDLSLREDGADDICRVEGNVVTVFQGRFQPGQRLRFSVPCAIDQPPVGLTVYHATDALDIAEVIEVHFGADGEVAGYGAGLTVLDAPTNAIAWRPSICQ